LAEWGAIERTSSGRVRGLAAPEVNLLSNMVKERCKQLTTWLLRKEHNIVHQYNLANSLRRLILSGIEKREQSPLRSKAKNLEVKKQR
jgi:fructose-bisphosphate aldolase class 1